MSYNACRIIIPNSYTFQYINNEFYINPKPSTVQKGVAHATETVYSLVASGFTRFLSDEYDAHNEQLVLDGYDTSLVLVRKNVVIQDYTLVPEAWNDNKAHLCALPLDPQVYTPQLWVSRLPEIYKQCTEQCTAQTLIPG